MKQRVFVGLSGGVDSSVAAKRLLERGYDVVGVFIKVWQPEFIHCNWEKERLDAMRVAAHLGIPFLTMNAEDTYKVKVAEYMIHEYEAGRTPNPDVMCNEFVKFGVFHTWARANGADHIATGHYAEKCIVGGLHTLHRAADASKDQSYFLARITQEALEHALFPIGNTLKREIRKEAVEAGIPTSHKPDSQGICFLGQVDIHSFLSHYLTLTGGAVLNEDGNVIGEHKGALLYTRGQRHGFTLNTASTRSRPHYVIHRDMKANTITVSTQMKEQTGVYEVHVHDIHTLGTGLKERMTALFRYHGEPVEVTLKQTTKGSGILKPDTHIHPPSSGQVCVLYSGTECCGSGIVE